MLVIRNATLVMQDHLIRNGTLVLENGLIIYCDEERKLEIPQDAHVIDAEGKFVGPGLIDIHTHAAGGKYFQEDPAYCANEMLRHGVTGILPALYYSMNKHTYLEAIDVIEKAACPNIIGLYMEGPYLNPAFGCDRENNPWAEGIHREDYIEIVERAKDLARVWCIAPEREGIDGFVQDVKRLSPKSVLSVAHAQASPSQIEHFLPMGLKLATHHTNATGDLPKYPECRGVSVDETVNYNDDIYAELIADSRGIHVDPYMLRLVEKIKGKKRIILISDAFVANGPIPPGYDGVTDINFDHAGEIAGSKLTLDVACRNMMAHTGCSIVDAFNYASGNPARLLNLTGKGELVVGNIADVIVTDHWMNVSTVIMNGKIVHEE